MGVISNYILLFPLLFTHSLKLLKTTSDSYLRMKMDYFLSLMLNLNKYKAGNESVLYL